MRRVVAAPLITFAVVYGMLALSSFSGASTSVVNGDIVFDRSVNTKSAVFRAHSDGSGQVQLTDGTAEDWGPAWSPDGNRIAFTSERDGNREIYVMNADGSGETRLTSHTAQDFSPTWTPDGLKIAFRSDRPGGDAWTIHPDGTNLVPIDLGGLHARVLDYSPDGTKLAFTAEDNDIVSVYIASADGSNPQKLTSSGVHEDDPRWSPDGTKIAFIRTVSAARAPSGLGGQTDLFVINDDGTGEVNLTNDALFDSQPAWSPDATTFVFYSERPAGDGLYLMNSDGGDIHLLLANGSGPDWQTVPEGSRLWGDGDCSGAVNPVDSLKTLRHDAGLGVDTGAGCPELGSEVQTGGDAATWGDVDCSGALNPVDSLKLLRHDAGLPVDKPSDCPSLGEFVVVT